MLYVQSQSQLDSLATKLAQHLKAPVTRIRSAIAKAEGYSHLSAFKHALEATGELESNPVEQLTIPEIAVLNELKEWLADNVEMGTDIVFDNEGEVNSQVLLPVMDKLLNGTSSASNEVLLVANQKWIGAVLADPKALAARNYEEFGYESDDAFFEGTEDSITDNAMAIAKHEQLAQALALLESAGLKDISDKVKDLAEAGAVFSTIT